MRFSQAFSPVRALQASWRMVAAAPAAMLIGGFLLMMAGGGRSGGRSRWGESSGSGGGSLSGGEAALVAVVVLFVVAIAIASWLFFCLIRVGFAGACESVLSKGNARVGELFEARGLWGKMVLATLLQALIGIAMMVPIGVVFLILIFAVGVTGIEGAEGVTIAIGLLLLVLYVPVMIYIGLGVSLMPQAVAIEGLAPVEAMHRSWELVNGHRIDLLIYVIVVGLFGACGVLLCCVGLILTGSMSQIASYESYLRLVRPEEDQKAWTLPPG